MPARRLPVFLSSCSQMRTTFQPSLRKNLFTLRSRALLPSSFFFQNERLFTGRFECFGQACQKQPSTKTAHLIAGNTKSGFPKTGRLRRQPVTRCLRNRLIKASSVSLFPLPRMRDMTCDRLVLVKTSGIVNWDVNNPHSIITCACSLALSSIVFYTMSRRLHQSFPLFHRER